MKSQWIRHMALIGVASFICFQASADDNASSTHIVSAQASLDSADKTKQNGASFMLENQTKPGVVTLPSGLQYKILEEGQGKKPTASDTVSVDYEGTLTNGKIFDSSYQRGQPATFPVMGVIKGWQEALQLMNTGATWMLYIPSTLAYGEKGAGSAIGPNETLIFKVKLLAIQ